MIPRLNKLHADLTRELLTARNPICVCDFRPDSILLLSAIRENQDIPILIFKDFWTDTPTQLINDWDLEAYFYKPFYVEYKRDGVIAWYNVAGKPFPVFTANLTKTVRPSMDTPYYGWDKTFVGKNFPVYESLVSPLADWTDAEIDEALNAKTLLRHAA